MELNEIRDNDGAHYRAKRVGRGIGSGKGKTAGRGVKGQTSRSGVAINAFEGGQMPIYRRLPKGGFTSPFQKEYAVLNIGKLQQALAAKRITDDNLSYETLLAAGLVSKAKHGLKLLGQGDVQAKIRITVNAASKSAVAAIEKAGGSVTIAA